MTRLPIPKRSPRITGPVDDGGEAGQADVLAVDDGTDDASSIGRDVSHGCIRISNEHVTALVEQVGLPLGVPVVVTA